MVKFLYQAAGVFRPVLIFCFVGLFAYDGLPPDWPMTAYQFKLKPDAAGGVEKLPAIKYAD